MQLEYYEAKAVAKLANVGRNRPMCLDDWHKLAWDLFCGGKHHYDGERPFVFRAQQLDDERVFILVRSDQSFPGAGVKQAEIKQGMKVTVDLCTIPLCRPKEAGGKELIISSERWEGFADYVLARAGITDLANPETALTGYYRMFQKKVTPIPVVQVSRTATVVDETAFGSALVHGVGRKRAYGMGTIIWR